MHLCIPAFRAIQFCVSDGCRHVSARLRTGYSSYHSGSLSTKDMKTGHCHGYGKEDGLHMWHRSRVLEVWFQPFLPIKAIASAIPASHLKRTSSGNRSSTGLLTTVLQSAKNCLCSVRNLHFHAGLHRLFWMENGLWLRAILLRKKKKEHLPPNKKQNPSQRPTVLVLLFDLMCCLSLTEKCHIHHFLQFNITIFSFAVLQVTFEIVKRVHDWSWKAVSLSRFFHESARWW